MPSPLAPYSGAAGILSYPTSRATSSMRSSSIVRSNRKLGGVTCQTLPLAAVTLMPRSSRELSTIWGGTACPSTVPRRSPRNVIGSILGKPSFAITSTTGPGSPPAISMSSAVARSMALACCVGSTPRSNRIEASVCKPKRLARPLIAAGGKYAASRNTSAVSPTTAVLSPPIIPARPIGPDLSVITTRSSSNSISRASSKVSLSPARA